MVVIKQNKRMWDKRTNSAIHSFFIIGDDNWIRNNPKDKSYGGKTLWEDLEKSNALWCELGTHPSSSYSFLHQCEYKREVEYREVVKFPIQYGETNKSEEIEYIYYARKKGVINNFEKIKKRH